MHPFLKVQRGLWDLIFTSNPCPMALVAPDGHFLEVNDAYCTLTRRSRTELLRLRFQAITRAEDVAADTAAAAAVRDGACGSYEMVKAYVGPAGENIWVRLGVQGVYESDALVCYVAVAVPVAAPITSPAGVPGKRALSSGWWADNWFRVLPYILGALAASYAVFAEWQDIRRERHELRRRLEKIESQAKP